MSSHLCVLQWGCTAASGAGWVDPGPAYLQHLFAGNFQETFKYEGETFPLGKFVEMQCLLLEPDLLMFSLADRSQGRGRGSDMVLPCSDSARVALRCGVPQQLPGPGQTGHRCHCQLEPSYSRYRTLSC